MPAIQSKLPAIKRKKKVWPIVRGKNQTNWPWNDTKLRVKTLKEVLTSGFLGSDHIGSGEPIFSIILNYWKFYELVAKHSHHLKLNDLQLNNLYLKQM